MDVPSYINDSGIVTRIDEKTFGSTYTLSFGKHHFHLNAKKGSYVVGDYVYVEAIVKPYRKQTIPHGFNASQYFLSNNVRGYLHIEDIKKIGYKPHLMTFRYHLLNETNQFKSSPWIQSFLFGQSINDTEVKGIFSNMGLIHLLQASGMHIYMLMLLVRKLLFYVDVKSHYQDLFACMIYLIFAYLHQFDLSLLRFFLMYILVLVNKRAKLRFSQLDLVQFVFLALLIYRIEWLFSVGFLILYLIMNFITLYKPVITRYEQFHQRYIISLIVFLILLPFYKTISLLTILLLPLLTMLITGPLFMMVIFSIGFPKLDEMTSVTFSYLTESLAFLQQKNIVLYMPALSSFFIVFYFLILIFLLRSTTFLSQVKWIFALIIICFHPFFTYQFNNDTRLYFLDVGQGDAIYIESPNCRILIDAFTNSHQFLKNKGVSELDYLILSHSDQDHTKEAYHITQHIRIKEMIISAHDNHHIPYPITMRRVNTNDHITCGQIKLDFFTTQNLYSSPNNASLVFKMTVHQTTILFTGDIEKEAEIDLSNRYGDLLKSDILKVAHHGSNTSSTSLFLSYVNPRHSVISLGYENRYQFPSSEVIHRLTMRGSEIYRTDTHGTIILSINEKKQKWSFYLPF